MPDAAPVTITTLPSTCPCGPLRRCGSVQRAPCASPCSTRSPSPGRGDPTASGWPTSTRSSRRWPASRSGWDAFWTVEHHFLEEYSHCSNPEVLYGAIAAQTERIRLGYGVRLMPKPYNHPVRTAESAAVLDLISNGRVDFGTGRSSTRAELEGFGIDPARDPRHVAGGHRARRRLLDQRRVRVRGRALVDAASGACCPSRSRSRTRRCGARRASEDGHRQVGELGLGLCSFAVGVPPEEVKAKIDIYREAIAGCTEPIGDVRPRPGGHLHDGGVRADRARRRGRRPGSRSSGTRRPAPG